MSSAANADAISVHRGSWGERPNYTGLAARADTGCIAIMLRGSGLILGPMTAAQMAELGNRLLSVADTMAAREDAAGDAALAELEALSTAAGDHDS